MPEKSSLNHGNDLMHNSLSPLSSLRHHLFPELLGRSKSRENAGLVIARFWGHWDVGVTGCVRKVSRHGHTGRSGLT
ncbi:unnamed protein product [Periconia digitata]|uniref:Uncharacterized protein n=1 Tax=Periconia digitata TaxID=1303443 RepID=A0A9W4XPS2_9PLEO|nr:unnamed protein product [Periconia digitata]